MMMLLQVLLEYNEKKDMKKKKKAETVFLNSWVARSSGNTTLVLFVTCHHDVTFVTPACTPARIIIIIIDQIFNREI